MRISITAAQRLLSFINNLVSSFQAGEPLVPTSTQRAAVLKLIHCTQRHSSFTVCGEDSYSSRAYAKHLETSILEAVFEFRFLEARRAGSVHRMNAASRDATYMCQAG